MGNFRYHLLWIIFIAAVIALGFVGFTQIDSGADNVALQKARDAETELLKTQDQLAELESELEYLRSRSTEEIPEPVIVASDDSSSSSSSQFGSLIDDLEKLRVSGKLLEPGDRGSAVGTIQKFLNLYSGENHGVDNDFGPTTRKLVEQFQKEQKLSADGGVGSGTLAKMISWLEDL